MFNQQHVLHRSEMVSLRRRIFGSQFAIAPAQRPGATDWRAEGVQSWHLIQHKALANKRSLIGGSS